MRTISGPGRQTAAQAAAVAIDPVAGGRRVLNVQSVIEQYGERLRRAALVLSGNTWDADDLCQEAFVILTQTADRFEHRSQVFTWVYGILLNVDRRRRRQAAARRRAMEGLQGRQPSQPATDPPVEMAAVAEEWKRGLWSRVHQLPDGQRQCLVLRFSEAMKYDEIAATMGIPVGTVKSRIYHGLLALRRLMELEGENADPPSPPHQQDRRRHVI